jgi:ectoine hydroxylase-related dioxygenase (phytanoyl-CoA dioxygenase family)
MSSMIVPVEPLVVPLYRTISASSRMWHRHDWANDAFYRSLVMLMSVHVLEGERIPFLYQKEPNLRLHYPGEMCVPWHADADFGHNVWTWNVWIPLTEITEDSQRLWVWMGGTQAEPVTVPLGHAFIFRGAAMRHGNTVNNTDTTRVSFDFRLLDKRLYRDIGAVTVRYGVPLRIGDYWEEWDEPD